MPAKLVWKIVKNVIQKQYVLLVFLVLNMIQEIKNVFHAWQDVENVMLMWVLVRNVTLVTLIRIANVCNAQLIVFLVLLMVIRNVMKVNVLQPFFITYSNANQIVVFQIVKLAIQLMEDAKYVILNMD